MNALKQSLVELAADIVHEKEITLETERGWFDQAELEITWDNPGFTSTITVFSEAKTYPATMYEPEETVWKEYQETEKFGKIGDLDEWAKRHGFDIESGRMQ